MASIRPREGLDECYDVTNEDGVMGIENQSRHKQYRDIEWTRVEKISLLKGRVGSQALTSKVRDLEENMKYECSPNLVSIKPRTDVP